MDSEFMFNLRNLEPSNRPHLNDFNDDSSSFGNIQQRSNVMCIIYKNSKLGATYYNLSDNINYVDNAPFFPIFKCLYREILPKHIVYVGSSTDSFLKVVIDVMNDQYSVTNTTTTSYAKTLPPDLQLVSSEEYPYEVCRAILQQVEVASFGADKTCDAMKEMFMQSLLNFDDKMSVHASGALVKYLDKNWALFSAEKELHIMHIIQLTLKKHVLIDWSSLNAFGVFQQKPHEASCKRGNQSNTREGMSVFKMFSSHCKSKLGMFQLRNILLNPISDLDELKKRVNFIEFALRTTHKEFIESLQDNIKKIVDVNGILLEVRNSKASNHGWYTLYRTINHVIIMNELCSPHRSKSAVLADLNDNVTPDLIGLHQTIQDVFDFSLKVRTGRPIIKFGIDSTLDAKKLQRKDISKHVTAAARLAVEELPEYLTECAVVYLPEMGHLISVKEWESDCDPEELSSIGYQFKFTLGGFIHYKSPLCYELDMELGDINAEIFDHENRIIQRVAGFVLKYNNDIRKPLRQIAMIDSLIAMSKVAKEKDFVKPTLNNNRIYEISGGWHPLMKDMFPDFVANDYFSGGNSSRIKILTGPNGSGKSIYLKQVGMIIYLAHVGSYVPAEKANIGILESIHVRLATESISVRLSAFMIDVTQMTQALHSAKPFSLIIMDEFGKGTSGEDGVVLMAGVLRKFQREKENCPHVLFSTHFQQITNYLPSNSYVEYKRMSYTTAEKKLILLYKVCEGISESFAFDIAEEAGLEQTLIDRAREIYNCLKNNEIIRPLPTSSK